MPCDLLRLFLLSCFVMCIYGYNYHMYFLYASYFPLKPIIQNKLTIFYHHILYTVQTMNTSRVRRRQHQTNIQKSDSLNKTVNIQTVNTQKVKIELIQKLNNLIENIGNIKNLGVCTEDPIIIGLENIQEQAKIYDFKEIMKMANLAIGKRILNLQLERKRNQIQNKIEKKREIQEYFRQNRIHKTNYQQIALEKLKENTLIVKPYSDGKAFVQSINFYEKTIGSVLQRSFEHLFDECNYMEVIKSVNKIFFNNFSNSSSQQSRKQASKNPILKLGFALLFMLASLCVALGFFTIDVIAYIIFGLNIIILLLMSGLAFYSYFTVKVGKNQLEETIVQINQYFNKLNERNKHLGFTHQWICPSHFLYLEIKFQSLD